MPPPPPPLDASSAPPPLAARPGGTTSSSRRLSRALGLAGTMKTLHTAVPLSDAAQLAKLRQRIERREQLDNIGSDIRHTTFVSIRIALFLCLLFALHFIVFTDSAVLLMLFGRTRSSFELDLISLGFALLIWWVMLLPAVSASFSHRRRPARLKRARAEKARGLSSAHPSEHGASTGSDPITIVRNMLLRELRIVTALHDTPNYWVARLTRLSVYCASYVWSTYYMNHRDECGRWDFASVPTVFFVINSISLWTTFFDYCLEVLSAGWEHVTTLGSLVTLVNLPIAIGIVSQIIGALSNVQLDGDTVPTCGERGYDPLEHGRSSLGASWQLNRLSADPNHYLLQFGWLRFLALHRVNKFTLDKLRVRSTRVRIASLAIAVLCIFFIIAGSMHTLEARLNGDDTFVNFFDFFYFAVVTGSTVGYGDFSPSTPLSRFMCISAIVITITWIPEQVGQLQAAFAATRTTFGTPPRAGERFVLLCGHVSPWQFKVFVRNYESLLNVAHHRPPEKLVLLTIVPLAEYEFDALSRFTQRRLFAYEGDMLSSMEVGTGESPFQLRDATHAFVYGSPLDENDSSSVLRVLALLNFVQPWAVTCLIQRFTNLTMTANMGVHNTLCVNDLKMRFLHKSMTDAPGMICLMANLLISSSEVGANEANAALAAEWDEHGPEDEGAEGGGVDAVQRASLSRGKTSAALRWSYDAPAGSSERRTDSRRASTDELLQTVTTEVRRMSELGSSATALRHGGGDPAGQRGSRAHASPPASARKARLDREVDQDQAATDDRGEYLLGAESQLIVYALPRWAVGHKASWLYERLVGVTGVQLLALKDDEHMHIWLGELKIEQTMEGVWIARSLRALARFVHSPMPPGEVGYPQLPRREPPPRSKREQQAGAPLNGTELRALQRGERVVILGAPGDVERMIKLVLDEERLASRFLHVVHVAAEPFEGVEALEEKLGAASRGPSRGGAAPKYRFVHADPLDHEVLKQHILVPGLHSVLIFNDKLSGSSASSDQRMGAVVVATKIDSMLLQPNRVRVLVALSSTRDVRFIERSLWWPRSDDPVSGHLTSPTFAAGAIFADEMLYPLMMSWTRDGLVQFCRLLTDELLDDVELKLLELPPELAERAIPVLGPPEPRGMPQAHAPSHPKAARRPGPAVSLESQRRSAHARGGGNLTYGELRYRLLNRGLLPIGLYRWRDQRSKDKKLRLLPFVFTNPPNDTRIRSTDRVYVLTRDQPSKSAAASTGEIRAASSKDLDDAARTVQRHVRMRWQADWLQRRQQALLKAGLLPDVRPSFFGKLFRAGGRRARSESPAHREAHHV